MPKWAISGCVPSADVEQHCLATCRQGYETCDVQMGSSDFMRKMLMADKGILLTPEAPAQ